MASEIDSCSGKNNLEEVVSSFLEDGKLTLDEIKKINTRYKKEKKCLSSNSVSRLKKALDEISWEIRHGNNINYPVTLTEIEKVEIALQKAYDKMEGKEVNKEWLLDFYEYLRLKTSKLPKQSFFENMFMEYINNGDKKRQDVCIEDNFQLCNFPKISNQLKEYIKNNKNDFLNMVLNTFNIIIPSVDNINVVSCSDPKLRNKILFDRFPQLFFLIQLYLKYGLNKNINTDGVFNEEQLQVFIIEVKKSGLLNGKEIIDFNEKVVTDNSRFFREKGYRLEDLSGEKKQERNPQGLSLSNKKLDTDGPKNEETPKPKVKKYDAITAEGTKFDVDNNTLGSILSITDDLYRKSGLAELGISIELVKGLTWIESGFDPNLNEGNGSGLCQITPILTKDISQKPDNYNKLFLLEQLGFSLENHNELWKRRFDPKTNLAICMVTLHNRIQKNGTIPPSIFNNLPGYKDNVKTLLQNKNIPVDDEKLANMIVKIAYGKDNEAEKLKRQFIALSYYNAVGDSNNTNALRIKYAISVLYISNYAKEYLPKYKEIENT